jgi:hypothetical protein
MGGNNDRILLPPAQLNDLAKSLLYVMVTCNRLRVIVMAPASKPKPSRVKVREHRQRLRRQGLRPIQIWVPDVRAPAFRSEAHRQSQAVAASSHARDDQAFVDAVSVFNDDTDRGE